MVQHLQEFLPYSLPQHHRYISHCIPFQLQIHGMQQKLIFRQVFSKRVGGCQDGQDVQAGSDQAGTFSDAEN